MIRQLEISTCLPTLFTFGCHLHFPLVLLAVEVVAVDVHQPESHVTRDVSEHYPLTSHLVVLVRHCDVTVRYFRWLAVIKLYRISGNSV